MALTFDKLFDRTSRTLEQAGKKLEELEASDAPSQRVQERTSATQSRIDELLNEYAAIAELASTQEQRQAYGAEEGAEKWHADFVMLRDVQLPENSRFRTAQEFRDYVWSKLPPGRFRRFQEIFSRPEHKCVPHFTVTQKGDIQFENSDVITGMKGCLVDADLIPDGLAEDLGLCDFEEDDGQPIERIRKKKEAIPRLKKIWESAQFLEPGNQRLLVIEQPNERVERSYPGIQGPDEATLGTILYVREAESRPDAKRPGAPRPPRKLLVQHFNSAYAALRKPLHVTEGYRQEIAQISEMSVALQTLNAKLNAQWSDESLRDALREEVTAMSDRFVTLFANVQNMYKVQARDFLQKFRELKDGRGRENPSAAMSQMIATITRLERRYRDMEPKGGFNSRDEMVLEKEVKAHEQRFDAYERKIPAAARVIGNGVELFNPEKVLTEDQVNMNVTGIQRRIDIDPNANLRGIKLQPFRAYRDSLNTEYAGLAKAFGNRNRDAAIDQTIKLHVIGKYRRLRKSIERMKELTMNPMTSVSDMRAVAVEMQHVFAEREVFPERTVDAIAPNFSAMARTLDLIEARLREYEGQTLDVTQRAEIYGKMKAYLDTFNIEELAMMSQ